MVIEVLANNGTSKALLINPSAITPQGGGIRVSFGRTDNAAFRMDFNVPYVNCVSTLRDFLNPKATNAEILNQKMVQIKETS